MIDLDAFRKKLNLSLSRRMFTSCALLNLLLSLEINACLYKREAWLGLIRGRGTHDSHLKLLLSGGAALKVFYHLQGNKINEVFLLFTITIAK